MTVEVLHVDDEPSFIETAERAYARMDESVRFSTATSAAEATEIIQTRPPDCVVSDYVTAPDGDAFIKTVHETRPETPLILVSGKSLDELPNQAVRAYLTDYVPKGEQNLFETIVDRIHRHTSEGPGSITRHLFLSDATSESTSVSTIDMTNGPTEGLLKTIADVQNCDVMDLPPLFDAIDVDAIEAIFSRAYPPDYPGVELRFQYDGFDILITNDGTVFVRELPMR